jgi:uncharacterized protein YbjT (DUF2867 family)
MAAVRLEVRCQKLLRRHWLPFRAPVRQCCVEPKLPKETDMLIAVAGATGRLGSHVVDVVRERGHDVVPISRTHGVDVITGEGLAQALVGVDCIIDAATGPSPEREVATEFFITSARNLHEAGSAAGVRRMVVVSIIGIDDLVDGYSVAKVAHERAVLEGPIPVRILRASQFHEFVAQLLDWGTRGDVGYAGKVRTQLVAARSVAETLVDLATDSSPADDGKQPFLEIAGPRAENFVDAATQLAAKRGRPAKVEEVMNPAEPDAEARAAGVLLPGPGAILAGPPFEDWLETADV